MRPRYYCEHCNKGNGSPSAMKRHEAGCTKNPARRCGMCAKAEIEQVPPTQLAATFAAQGFKALEVEANGCPACILATLRAVQSVEISNDELGEIHAVVIGGVTEKNDDGRHAWAYSTAKAAFWAEYNSNQSEHY